MRSVRFAARRRVSRGGGIAVLALWCLLSLVSGAGQALCLDLGGDCVAPGAAGARSCHAEGSGNDFASGCGACVDVPVPEDASTRCDRPDDDLQARAVAASPAADGAAFLAGAAALRPAAPPGAAAPPHPSLRTAVLLI